VMAHFVKSEEGSPLSGVVLGVGGENIELSIFRLGNLVGTANVARSVSIVDDLAEGLTRFAGGDTLPSRFLLYDGKEGDLEEVRQSLLKANWDNYEKIKFLHTPKIEIITPEEKVRAVSLAGASEIADVSSLDKKDEEKAKDEGREEPTRSVAVPEGSASPEDLGFMVGQDVAADSGPVKKEPRLEPQISSQRPVKEAGLKKNLLSDILRKVKLTTTSFFAKVGMESKMGGLSGKKAMVLGGGFFLAFIIFGFIAWWYLPSATVTVYISPKRLDEKETIFIDPDISSPNFASATLPGDVITTTVSGERTKSTTGTKTVGEKARGTVKIQNGTAQNIKLPVDTILVSSGDLEFALTETASVSAALSPSSPGTATVEVVATDIGAEYNLAKDESFSVGNYLKAEVDAVATADFSGGSSRQISAVSAEDQSQLEDDLTEELLDKAKAELAGKASENQSFIEESVSATPSSESFNHKVGDEADNLKLSLSLDVLGIVADKQSLSDWAREILKDKIPEGFVLREDQIGMRFELEGENDGVYELTAYMDVNLLPEIKPDEIAKKIAGKYAPLAENYLTSISGFTRAEINLKPPLPGRLGTLPHVAKKIEVELAAER